MQRRFHHFRPSAADRPGRNRHPKYERLPCYCPESSAGRRLQKPTVWEAEPYPRGFLVRVAGDRPLLARLWEGPKLPPDPLRFSVPKSRAFSIETVSSGAILSAPRTKSGLERSWDKSRNAFPSRVLNVAIPSLQR